MAFPGETSPGTDPLLALLASGYFGSEPIKLGREQCRRLLGGLRRGGLLLTSLATELKSFLAVLLEDRGDLIDKALPGQLNSASISIAVASRNAVYPVRSISCSCLGSRSSATAPASPVFSVITNLFVSRTTRPRPP